MEYVHLYFLYNEGWSFLVGVSLLFLWNYVCRCSFITEAIISYNVFVVTDKLSLYFPTILSLPAFSLLPIVLSLFTFSLFSFPSHSLSTLNILIHLSIFSFYLTYFQSLNFSPVSPNPLFLSTSPTLVFILI